jgi:hypothetical protein
VLPNDNPGVWYEGPTSPDLVSPERRRNPDDEAAIGTGGLRYPYSPEQSPARARRADDRLGSTMNTGGCRLRVLPMCRAGDVFKVLLKRTHLFMMNTLFSADVI